MSAGVYGITAWPPKALTSFVEDFQAQHGVQAYGQPHFNLRYPFLWAGTEEELIERVQSCARIPRFRAWIDGWAEFPSALYIAIRATSKVLEAHERVLEVGGTPLYAGLDQHDYVPHVTVALGLTDENRRRILSATRTRPMPRRSWTVTHLALTRDENGRLLELSRVPLAAATTRNR